MDVYVITKRQKAFLVLLLKYTEKKLIENIDKIALMCYHIKVLKLMGVSI